MIKLQRSPKNPILIPDTEKSWEAHGAFNGSVVEHEGTYHMVYRALSEPKINQGVEMRVSSIGYATSTDGVTFGEHKLLIEPTEDWEIYGAEDPRITFMDGKFYIFYTALSVFPFAAYGIKTAVAITRDFITFEKHPVSTFNAKAMALFPEKINGKYAALITINTDLPPAKISLALFDTEEEIWSPLYWQEWHDNVNDHTIHLLRDLNDQVELGSAPIKTKDGWLVIYSYIKKYMTDDKEFYFEAMLLDEKDPHRILARTEYSLLSPEEDYELYGDVPNVIFPSGALAKDGQLHVYYGAADTRVAVASCSLNDLLADMQNQKREPDLTVKTDPKRKFVRFEGNPILEPIIEFDWQAQGVFNPASVYENGIVHIIYRAQALDGTSYMGYASSKDGFHIDENLDYPIYIPRKDFEMKPHGQGNSGCEDPRITRIGDRYYVTYTAFNGISAPRVAMSSIKVSDFLAKNWIWDEPKLISLAGVDDKDACIVEGKKPGTYLAFHRLGDSIWLDITDNIEFNETLCLAGEILAQPRRDKWDNVKLGIAGPPLETDKGWLLIYHGVSEPGFYYKLGAMLLDYDNPMKILARTDYPIFEPETPYEKVGVVNNVVFPCGAVVINGIIYMYYGGADQVIGVATMPLNNLVNLLLNKV
jgi:predicted GH43/DUF377 family glycosyl hydrolase